MVNPEVTKNWLSKLSDDMKAKVKEVSESLKVYMAEVAPAGATALASQDAALADGTAIKFTPDASGALGVGSDITIVTPEGETPAPDGELTLSDNTVIVVAGGKVTEVKPAAPEEMKDEAKNLADVKERVTKIVEKFDAQFTAQENENKKLKIEIENLKLKLGKQAKLINDTFSVIEAFGSIETAEPIEKPVSKKLDKLSKLIEMSKGIK